RRADGRRNSQVRTKTHRRRSPRTRPLARAARVRIAAPDQRQREPASLPQCGSVRARQLSHRAPDVAAVKSTLVRHLDTLACLLAAVVFVLDFRLPETASVGLLYVLVLLLGLWMPGPKD